MFRGEGRKLNQVNGVMPGRSNPISAFLSATPVFISFFFLLSTPAAQARIQQWDFQAAEDYRYDAEKIQLADGQVSLRPSMPFRQEGQEAFNRGTYLSNTWAGRQALELSPSTPEPQRAVLRPVPLDEKIPGMTALWHFDEPTGTNVLDLVHRTVAKNSDTQIASGQPAFGQSRFFDGKKSHVFIPHYKNFDFNGPFTLEFWFKPTATMQHGPQTLISKWQAVTQQKSFSVQITPQGILDFQVSPDGAQTLHHFGSTLLTPDAWHHGAFVFDGTDLRIYLNGVLENPPTRFRGPVFQTQNPIYLGALISERLEQYFEGVIDELAFYNRALSETEARAHFGNHAALTGLWHLDEKGGVLKDTSGYGQDGMAQNAPTYEVQGMFANALHLNGMDQFVQIPASMRLAPQGELTLEAWIKPDRLPVSGRTATVVSLTQAASEFALRVDDFGRLRTFAPTLEPAELGGRREIIPHNWYHVAATWGHGQVRVYVNGVLDQQGYFNGTLNTEASGLLLGMDRLRTGAFHGAVDEAAVYRRVRTRQEIARGNGHFPEAGEFQSAPFDAGSPAPWRTLSWGEALAYGEGFSGQERGLLHLYHLDEAEISTLADSRGEVRLSSVGTYTVPGIFGSARWFKSGGLDKVLSQGMLPPLSTFGYSLWFQFASAQPGSKDRIFSIGDERLTVYRSAPTGRLQVKMAGARDLVSVSMLSDTEWHHLALTADGSRLFLYIDGVLESQTEFTGMAAGEPLVIGNLKLSDTFEGAVDEFALFNFALPAEQVREHFLTGRLDVKMLVRSSQDSEFRDTLWRGPAGPNRIQRQPDIQTAGLWRFNDETFYGPSGGIRDESRFHSHGRVFGEVQASPAGALAGGAVFNGVSDYIVVPDHESFHTADALTLAAWIRPENIEDETVKIIDKSYRKGSPTFSSFSLELAAGNRLGVKLGFGSGYFNLATERAGEIAAGKWSHVAATYDGRQVRLYINGVLKKSQPFLETLVYDNGSLYLGRYGLGGTGFFQGMMDEVSIDARAMNGEEIFGLYQNGNPQNYYRKSDLESLDLTTARYFQYLVRLDTGFFPLTPSLRWAEVSGSKYPADRPSVRNEIPVSFAEISHFRESTGKEHAGAVTYQLSRDGANWFFHNGRHWVIAADPAESNTASQISQRIREFAKDVGLGSFYFRAFLHSPTGVEQAALDAVEIEYLPNKLTLTAPNGGEPLLIGSDQMIRWNTAGEVGDLRIEYSKDGFKNDIHIIASNIPNRGSFPWTVPNDASPYVMLRVMDALDPRIYDTTDLPFRITGSFEVLSPNWNERWEVGSKHEITWKTLGTIPQVSLAYSTDEFKQAVYPIVDAVANDGKYVWTVPDHISSSVKVRVSDVRDSLVYDQSNDAFRIVGALHSVAPKPGETLIVGSEAGILWTSDGTIGAVKLEYAMGAGGGEPHWLVIEDAVPDEGSYTWRVPDAIDGAVRVRVRDEQDPSVEAVSEPFAITGDLELTLPRGGEQWPVGSDREITWKTTGTIPAVNVAYLVPEKGAEDTWRVIEKSLTNTGSFVWTVPSQLAEGVRFRVSDARDEKVASVSKGPVKIIPGFILNAPNGGEDWKIGTEHDIAWETRGTIPDVKLEYSNDNFVRDIRVILDKVSNVGRYAWEIPDDAGLNFRVRVSQPSNPAAADASDSAFRIYSDFVIVSPKAGVKFEVGSFAKLEWGTVGTVPEVRLEYSKDHFTKDRRVIAPSLKNTGSYNWEVPDDIGTYQFRITDVRDERSFAETTESFSIVGNFYITRPAPGEKWTVGTLQKIHWKGAGSVSAVRIDYSEDGFKKSYVTLAEATPNVGSFEWQVPDRPNTEYSLRIWDASEPQSMYQMDIPARIIGGFTLEAPNGGEVLYVGETAEFRWKTFGTVPQVRLEYSTDQFVKDIREITDAYPNAGRYVWEVPDVVSDRYLVRISDPGEPAAADISNSPFRIRSRVTMLTPNGGEAWAIGETHSITWRTSGRIPEVALEYSVDDFESSTPIVESAENTGTYAWTVPDRVSGNVKVRVMDARDKDAADISDAPFRIRGILELTAPAGGEVLRVGETVPVSWKTTGDIQGVRLSYSRDGFSAESTPIIDSIANEGSYLWTVPDAISSYVQVRVADARVAEVHSSSRDSFQIAPSFEMVGPNGGEVWHAREKREIHWASLGTVPEVDLRVCDLTRSTLEGCAQEEAAVIDRRVLNTGRYLWDIPRLVGEQFKIMVCDSRYRDICDLSDQAFKLQTPFDIVYPRSHESWPVASNQEIRWQTYGRIDRVLVQYASVSEPSVHPDRYQGLEWVTLAEALPNQGRLLFQVPDDVSQYVLFRVADWEDEGLFSVSPSPVKYAATFDVLKPDGGEAWPVASEQTVEWTNLGTVANVRLEYSGDNFKQDVHLIESSIGNKGTYQWRIPDSQSETVTLRVMDAGDPAVSAASAAPFKIMAGFNVLTPGGGERWPVGSKHGLKWETSGEVAWVDLAYAYVDPDVPAREPVWKPIVDRYPNNGIFAWRMPNEVGHVRVRVSDHEDPEAFAVSGGTFEILPDVIMASPNGGELWTVGKPVEIRWVSIGSLGEVALEYSKDNFESDIQPIATRLDDEGRFLWAPVNDITAHASVRVRSLTYPGVEDSSDQPFKILPSFRVLSPVKDEKWTVAANQAIEWDWRGTVDQVSLEYSVNNFVSSNKMAEGISNTGRFPVTVPDLAHAAVRFRIRDARHPDAFADSETFKIIPGYEITVPNGGELWKVGERRLIEWNTIGTNSRVFLEYQAPSRDLLGAPEWKTIGSVLRNVGRYEWQVPDSVSSAVRVRVVDTMDPAAMDVSDRPFKILGKLKILAPKPAEVLQVGTAFAIRWETTGDIPAVRIEYGPASADGPPAQYRTLESGWDNKGVYYWTVPDAIGESMWLKISDALESDTFVELRPFRIRGGFKLHLPDAGTPWLAGSSKTLEWETTGSIPYVTLEYRLPQAADWAVIAEAAANSGRFGWTVPDQTSENVRLRISDPSNPAVKDIPEQTVTIAPEFQVVSPASQAVLTVGTPALIEWNTVGYANKVELDYQVNETWHPIAGPMADEGRFQWRVPDEISGHVRIRVRDGHVAEAFAISEPFEIRGALEWDTLNEGAVWPIGTAQSIRWKTTGTLPHVRLEYRVLPDPRDLPAEAQSFVIEEAVKNTGAYTWQVPDILSDRIQLRVTDVRNPAVRADTREFLSIIGILDLVSPADGEVWTVGSRQQIAWNSVGDLPGVILEYSRDDFYHDVNVIASDMPNGGSALWTVPDAISDTVKFRIQNAADSRTLDVSEKPLAIKGGLQFVRPYGEAVWTVGTDEALTWVTTGTIPQVRLEYSRDDFLKDVQIIENVLDNRNAYVWRIPDIISRTLKLRLVDARDDTVRAVSDRIRVQGNLHLTSPVGGEVLTVLAAHPVTWTTDGTVPKIKIEYSSDDFVNDVHIIAREAGNTGRFVWHVADAVGKNVRLRISDASNAAVAGVSPQPFEIRGDLQFLMETRDQRWVVDGEKILKWNTLGTVPRVDLEYSKDNFVYDIHEIGTSLINQGHFVWRVPDDISDHIRFRVRNTDDPAVAALSKDPVKITGALELTGPKAHEIFEVGGTGSITWKTTGSIPLVRLEYAAELSGKEMAAGETPSARHPERSEGSASEILRPVGPQDDKYTWKLINGAADNTGSYEWTVPDAVSDKVRVRITDLQDPEVADVSMQPFAIIGALDLLSPQGGERWIVGTEHDLLWRTTGTVPYVRIDYSTDGFHNETVPVADRVLNTGRYAWTLPDKISPNVDVRVRNLFDERVEAVSAAPMSIIGDFVLMKPMEPVSLHVGEELAVEWQTVGSIPEVRFEYLYQDPQTYEVRSKVVQDRIPNRGSYLWRIPDHIGGNMRLRLSDPRDSAVATVAPMPFDIQARLDWITPAPIWKEEGEPRPGVSGGRPRGGEVWKVDEVQRLEWKSWGTVPQVALEYSTDGFQKDIRVLEQAFENRNQYFLGVPDLIGERLQLRVRDVREASVSAVSPRVRIEGNLEWLRPFGGETFVVGQEQALEWKTTGTIPAVRLEYSTDGFKDQIYTLDAAAENKGSYLWKLPDAVTDKVWLRISDTRQPEVEDVLAEPFAIRGDLKLLSLQTGENLRVGQKQPLRWQTTGTIPKVHLEYSADGFHRDVHLIVKEIENTGGYDWIVPDFIREFVDVRVVDALHPEVEGRSGKSFGIRGSLDFANLFESQTVTVGDSLKLAWNTVGTIPNVRIELSTDEFQHDLQTLNESVPNTGAYLWKAADLIHAGIRFRISDSRDPSVSALSPATVEVRGDFRWVHPEGSEVWIANDLRRMGWETIGTIPRVTLDYSTDGFQKEIRPIEQFFTNQNQYEWRVPDSFSSHVQLRVRDASNADVAEISPVFNIRQAIEVLSPAGGEVWKVGEERPIRWRTQGSVPKVRMEYSRDDFKKDVQVIEKAALGLWFENFGTEQKTYEYAWKVPDAIADRVYVRISDVRDPAVTDRSGHDFKIAGVLELTRPHGGEVWKVGDEEILTWKTAGSVPEVRLELSRDGFINDIQVLKDRIPNQGNYLWKVSDIISEQVWVRVADARDKTVWDSSAYPVHIRGSLQLISPQGGEVWKVGSEQILKWQSTGTIPDVRIEYRVPFMLENFWETEEGEAGVDSSLITLKESVPNQGEFRWVVPASLPSHLRLRVADARDAQVFSETAAPVKIQGVLEFVAPDQPEVWRVGERRDLLWKSRGTIHQVRLEYSRDGFKEDRGTVASFLPNTGQTSWLVPDLIAEKVWFRLTDLGNPEVDAVTKAPLEIKGRIDLMAPLGGENWHVGEGQDIRWQTFGSVPEVRIEYSRDQFNQDVNVIVANLANRGRYTWQVPDVISDTLWIRVADAEDPETFAVTHNPLGVHGGLSLKEPVGGEIFHVGQDTQIRWDSVGSIDKVHLIYSTDDFVTALPVATRIENTGSFKWRVPDAVSDRVQVRVMDAADSRVYATTALPFKIQGGLDFIHPRSRDFWTVGSQRTLSWQTYGTIPYVNLEYSYDGFRTTLPVVLGLANSGSYNWTVPNLSADEIHLKISNAADQSVFAVAPEPMRIGGEIRLRTPAGGEVWRVGETQEIIWETTGTIPQVRLELSSDGFKQDTLVLESALPNSGSYAWKVPPFLMEGLQIRVSDARQPLISAVTKVPFKIVGALQFLSPAGGEHWKVGSQQAIQWKTYGTIPRVRLEYSVDGFHTVMPVASEIANTESFLWKVPDLVNQRIQLRLGDIDNPSVRAVTDDPVFIEGVLTLTSPKGGEVWKMGAPQMLAWQSFGTIPFVNIEHSTDDFIHSEPVASRIANTGSFLWTVPAVSTRNLKIRIWDSENPSTFDQLSRGVETLGELRLLEPRGGEVWIVGSQHAVRWQSLGLTGQVRLEYSTDRFRTTYPIITAVDASAGSFEWTVPDSISQDVRIRVVDVTRPGLMSETAQPFEVRGALRLREPAGGEFWTTGSAQTIAWDSIGTIPQVRIELSQDDFVSQPLVLTPAVPNRGVFPWKVPALPGREAKVRVTDLRSRDVFDMSRSPFYIVGAIELLFPNEGMRLQAGSTVPIRWRSTPNVANVRLEYSLDNFETTSIISAVLPNTGEVPWRVPDIFSDNLKVRVSNAQDATVFDVNRLALQVRGALQISSPAGGEAWPVASTQTLRWNTIGTIPHVRLEYSKDDFATVFPIAANVPNTGSYNWSVPSDLGGQIKIRVSDVRDPSVEAATARPVELLGKLKLVAPSGGERWIVNQEQTLRWETQGWVGRVALEYSKDSFRDDVHLIASDLMNTGSYLWRVPHDLSKNVRVRVRSAEDARVQSVSEDFFRIDLYQIQWLITDEASKRQLTDLSLSDSTGKTRTNLVSPVSLNFPYGIHSVIWSKAGYESYKQTWLADEDKSFEVKLKAAAAAEGGEQPRANFDYDAVQDLMRITAWLERDARMVPAVMETEIQIFKAAELIKTLRSTHPDAKGYFQLVWHTADFEGDYRYTAAVTVTTSSGRRVTSPLSFEIYLPVKKAEAREPRYRAAAMSAASLGWAGPLETSLESEPALPISEGLKKDLFSGPSRPFRRPEEFIPPPVPAAPDPDTGRTYEWKSESEALPWTRSAYETPAGNLIVPEKAVMQETVSVTYVASVSSRPVVDIYDGNGKLIVRSAEMRPTQPPGTFTYLLPVQGIGFVPGKPVTVTVIDRATGKFQSAKIQIQSSPSALGWDRQIGTTSVLRVLYRLERLIDEMDLALRGVGDMRVILGSFDASFDELAMVLSAEVLDPTILKRIDELAEKLSMILEGKGFDADYLKARSLAPGAKLGEVGQRLRDLRAAVDRLGQVYLSSTSRQGS